MVGKKALLTGIAASALVACAALAQAQSLPANCSAIAKEYPGLKGKTIAVGYNTAEANYTAVDPKNPNKIIGIEPSLLHTASECLGFKYTLQGMDFAGLIPALQSGRVQLIMGGMYASDKRAKQINFVEYMKAGEAMLVQAGNPKKLTDLQHTCGVIAAEIVGTVENAILAKQSKACEAAGKGPIKPLSFPSNDRAFSAVALKRADIMMTDAGVAGYLAKTNPKSVAVGYAVPSDFKFGMGMKKSDTSLMNGLEAVFLAMYKDGSLQQELANWGFPKSQMIEPVTKTK